MPFTLQQLIDAGLPAVSTDGLDAEANTQFSRSLTPAEWQTYLTIADPDRAAWSGEYQTALDQLDTIANYAAPTNAQVIAAVKYMAKVLRILLKIIARKLV